MNATRPLTVMSPLVGWSRPATSDSSVDLPQPDAPMRQVNSPGAAVRDTWSRARTAEPPRPYTLETPARRDRRGLPLPLSLRSRHAAPLPWPGRLYGATALVGRGEDAS